MQSMEGASASSASSTSSTSSTVVTVTRSPEEEEALATLLRNEDEFEYSSALEQSFLAENGFSNTYNMPDEIKKKIEENITKRDNEVTPLKRGWNELQSMIHHPVTSAFLRSLRLILMTHPLTSNLLY